MWCKAIAASFLSFMSNSNCAGVAAHDDYNPSCEVTFDFFLFHRLCDALKARKRNKNYCCLLFVFSFHHPPLPICLPVFANTTPMLFLTIHLVFEMKRLPQRLLPNQITQDTNSKEHIPFAGITWENCLFPTTATTVSIFCWHAIHPRAESSIVQQIHKYVSQFRAIAIGCASSQTVD